MLRLPLFLLRECGGGTVCLTQIQAIDYDSFSRLQVILPHISPHIKIRVTVDVSESGLDLIIGGGAAGRRGLRLRGSLLRLVGGFKS